MVAVPLVDIVLKMVWIFDLTDFGVNLVMTIESEIQGLHIERPYDILKHAWVTLRELLARRLIHWKEEAIENEKGKKEIEAGTTEAKQRRMEENQKLMESRVQETDLVQIEKRGYIEVVRCMPMLDLNF